MPVYKYRCMICGYTFDHSQHMQDEPLTKCPKCSGKLERVPQPTAIIFRGTGWGKDK